MQFSKNPFGKKRAGWEAGATALPPGAMLPPSVLHTELSEHGLNLTGAPGLMGGMPMGGMLHAPSQAHMHTVLPGINGE